MNLSSLSNITVLLTLIVHQFSIRGVSALTLSLSSLWDFLGLNVDHEWEESVHEDLRYQLMFPRRDLMQDLGGKENYEKLVNHALGVKSNSSSDGDQVAKEGGEIEEEGKSGSSKLVYGVDVSFPMHHLPDDIDDEDDEEDDDDDDDDGENDYDENDAVSNLQKNQNKVYQKYISGCNEFYSFDKKSTKTMSETTPSSLCNEADKNRFDMNLNQPRIMQNYTMLGFQKTKIPKTLLEDIRTFWKQNHMKQQKEAWGRKKNGDDTAPVAADTHVNHWSSPTYMVHIDNPYFEGGGMELKNYIWHVARLKLEKWINTGGGSNFAAATAKGNAKTDAKEEGVKWTLSPTSLYGVRVYKEGSILAPHVDRLPLVTSAIINVDQDVDEDWPLVVIGHDGVAYNVTMEPGDMLLYESHSVIHGRPYPLKGKYYANIFVHFEPSGHCVRHSDRMSGYDVKIDDAKTLYEQAQKKANAKYEKAKKKAEEMESKDGNVKFPSRYEYNFEEGVLKPVKKTKENMEKEKDLNTPYYIPAGSIDEQRWNQRINYHVDKDELKGETIDTHKIAGNGKLSDLIYSYQLSPLSIIRRDENGWQPLHEAARGGHLNVVKYLVEQGSNIDSRTGNGGTGGSVLWWAIRFHGEDHPVAIYLKEQNAVSTPPKGFKEDAEKTEGSESDDEESDSKNIESDSNNKDSESDNKESESNYKDSESHDEL